MSTITITINTDNAAFGESESDMVYEVSRILSEGLSLIDGHKLRDLNGNTVGKVEVK